MKLIKKKRILSDYLVIVRGAFPADVSERVSRIHTEAILKLKEAIVIKRQEGSSSCHECDKQERKR